MDKNCKDIYIKDKEKVCYNIEIQKTNIKEILKRSECYQSTIHLQFTPKDECNID